MFSTARLQEVRIGGQGPAIKIRSRREDAAMKRIVLPEMRFDEYGLQTIQRLNGVIIIVMNMDSKLQTMP